MKSKVLQSPSFCFMHLFFAILLNFSKRKQVNTICLTICLAMLGLHSYGQTNLVAWDFTGKGGQAEVTATNIVSGISTTSPSAVAKTGAGLTAENYLSNGLTARDLSSITLAESIADNDYITFTITPATGKSISITDIRLRPISQNTTRSFAVFSSKNGFDEGNVINTISGSGYELPLQTVAFTGHTDITTATEIRVYIYGGNNIYESVGIGDRRRDVNENDLIIDGTIQSTTGSTDVQPPTPPLGLVATSVTASSFNLSWSPSTDDVGVESYDVYNGTARLNTTPVLGTSYEVTGLISGTSYNITVIANDASGNSSVPSDVLSVTTAQGTGGTVILETWTNINGTAVTDIPTTTPPNNTVSLSTLEIPSDAADSYGVRIRGYIVPTITGDYTFYIASDDNGELRLSTDSLPVNELKIAHQENWTNSREWTKYPSQQSSPISLIAGQKYYFEALMKEGDGGDNLAVGWSGPGITDIAVIGSENIALYTPPPDTAPPSIPLGLTAADIAPSSFNLSWSASTDDVGVVKYRIYRNGVLTDSTNGSTTNISITGLSAATVYSMIIVAVDAANNASAQSVALDVTTAAPDVTAPSVPTGLTVSSIAASSFRLTWQASTDNYSVSKYILYLNNDSVATTSALTYTFLNLTAATTYNVKVVAVDNSGNKSAESDTVSATTAAFQLEGITENFNDGDLNGWNAGSYGLTNDTNTLKVVANKGGNVWSAFSYAFNLVDISLYPYVTFKVKSKFDVNIAVAVGNLPSVVDAYPLRLQTIDQINSQEIISGNSEWQEYTFDFTGVTHADLSKVDYVQFLVNYLGTINSPLDSNIFYIEDLRIGKDAKSMAAVTSLRDISFSAGSALPKTIQFYGLTDGSDGTHPLTITAASSNTELVPNPAVVYTSPAKTGTITIAPNNGVTGEAVITLKVSAEGVADKLSTFKVTVTGNHAPLMTPLANVLATTGDTLKIPLLNISDGDADEEQTVALTATSDNNTILPAGNISIRHDTTATTGVLSIVSAPGAASGSSAGVSVFLKDNGGTSLNGVDSNRYNFTVTFYTKVNHAPTITPTGTERLASQAQPYSIPLTGISDGDDGTQALTATVTPLSNNVGTGYAVGDISSDTASLTFTGTGNIGTDTVIVRITDNGGNGNNGPLFVEDTVVIIGNAAPQSWFVNNFNDASSISAWYGDPSAHTLTVEHQQLHIKTDIHALSYPGINVDLLAQTGGKYVDVSKKKYVSFNMRAATTNTNNPGTISIALLDDDAIADGYYTRTIFTQNVPADGLVHHYVFDYTGKFYTQNNLTLDSTHIKGLLINIDNDYFNAYTGDYYMDDFKMGDSAEVSFTPVNTIAAVSDHTYVLGQTPTPITLTGISDGNGNLTTGLTISANNNVVQNLAVTPAVNGSAQLSFTLNTAVTDSSVIRVIADNAAIATDIPDTMYVKIFVVDTATAGTNEVQIALTQTHQTMIGLGSVALSNSSNGFQKTTEQNITLMRIFGDFDEMENENDNGDPYSLNIDKLKIDQGRLDFYRNINETTTCHQFFYTVLGPPAWLKSNKSRYPDPSTLWADNNKLNPGLYEEYAEFLTGIIKIFKEKAGIDLYGISLQNEPQFNEPYPSCQITGDEFKEIIKVVGDRFKKEGITTRIIMPEDVGLNWTQEKVNPVVDDTAAAKYLDIIAVHNYGDNGIAAGGGTESAWTDTYNWYKTTPANDLWMTETSGFTDVWEGEMVEDYLNPGQYNYAPGPFGFSGYMFSALKKGQISAWVDLDSKENSVGIRSAFKQYSTFVQPGDVMIDATSLSSDILSIAFRNAADSGVTIVLYNTSYQPQKVKITGDGVPLKYNVVYTANNVNFMPDGVIENGYYLMAPRSIATLRSMSSVLPVTQLNLKATRNRNTIEATWKTVSESNNRGFYVERSADAIHFTQTLGYVSTQARNGFSSGALSYRFTDAAPINGRNFYRLKQIDNNNKVVYSNIAYADMDGLQIARVLNIHPNPVVKNQPVSVLVETSFADAVTLQIVDGNGRLISQKAVNLTAGSNTVTITTGTLASGIYYFKLNSQKQYENSSQKFMVQ